MAKHLNQIFKFDVNALIGLLIISLPVSVKLFFPPINTEVIYPAEIFIGLLTVLFFYNLFFRKRNFFFADKSFLKHPLTYLVLLYLIVNILSAFFSTIHLVSLKALIVKFCYILVFYFMIQPLIRSSFDNFSAMFIIYGFSLSIVTVYSLVAHIHFDFNRGNAAFISNPFFNDHTIYAAALAFLIPAFISFSFFSKIFEINHSKLILIFFTLLLFIIGIYFSFCRAGWISILVSFLLLLLIIAGVRFYGLLFLCIVFLFLIWFNHDSLINSFKQNKIDSNTANAGIYEQVFSITNITNDVSNAERLNRWSCAIRMFLDKPLLGFGPGTYQFQYFSYQRKEEMTIISLTELLKAGATTYSWSPAAGLNLPINASTMQGNGGAAHSEYFLELSETGIFSLIIFIGIFIVSLYVSLRIFSKFRNKKIRIIALFTLLGLVTYFVHGLFNNFLDDCKLAFLFWASLSALVTLDDISSRPYENERKVIKQLQ